MTLKEQMAGDVADLFFMLEDFGETHKIEGKPVDIVVDNDELVKLKPARLSGLRRLISCFMQERAIFQSEKRRAPSSTTTDASALLSTGWKTPESHASCFTKIEQFRRQLDDY